MAETTGPMPSSGCDDEAHLAAFFSFPRHVHGLGSVQSAVIASEIRSVRLPCGTSTEYVDVLLRRLAQLERDVVPRQQGLPPRDFSAAGSSAETLSSKDFAGQGSRHSRATGRPR